MQDITELPVDFHFTLRFPSESRYILSNQSRLFNWHTNRFYPAQNEGPPRANDSDYGGEPFYYTDGFLPIQDCISKNFIEQRCIALGNCEGGSLLPTIKMQRLPYPPYEMMSYQVLDVILGIVMVIAYVYFVFHSVYLIAVEKEKLLIAIMRIMGTPFWLHWICWFLRSIIFVFISIFIFLAILTV